VIGNRLPVKWYCTVLNCMYVDSRLIIVMVNYHAAAGRGSDRDREKKVSEFVAQTLGTVCYSVRLVSMRLGLNIRDFV